MSLHIIDHTRITTKEIFNLLVLILGFLQKANNPLSILTHGKVSLQQSLHFLHHLPWCENCFVDFFSEMVGIEMSSKRLSSLIFVDHLQMTNQLFSLCGVSTVFLAKDIKIFSLPFEVLSQVLVSWFEGLTLGAYLC